MPRLEVARKASIGDREVMKNSEEMVVTEHNATNSIIILM